MTPADPVLPAQPSVDGDTTNYAITPAMWVLLTGLVTVFALILRWYYVSTALVVHPLRGDAIQYFHYAWNLAHHGVFAHQAPGSLHIVASSYRDPGYPLLLAAWMKVFHDHATWYAAVLLCQAVLGALTVTMTMQLGRRWLKPGWAVAAGLLLAAWPHNITLTGYLLTETLFGFLCMAAMLLTTQAIERQQPARALAAGLCFGMATLTNAVLLPFGMLLAGYLLWRRNGSRAVCIAMLVGAITLPGAWAVRNAQLPTQPVSQSSTGRAIQNLVQGSWPLYHDAFLAYVKGDPLGKRLLQRIDAETALLQTTPLEGTKRITARIMQSPGRYLAWYLLEKPRLLWGWRIRMGQNDIYVYPTAKSPFDTQPAMRAWVAVAQVINPLVALLALAAVITAAMRYREQSAPGGHPFVGLHCTVLLTVFVTMVYGALQAEPRYAIPFRPYEMLLAATACGALASLLRKRKPSRMAPLAIHDDAPTHQRDD